MGWLTWRISPTRDLDAGAAFAPCPARDTGRCPVRWRPDHGRVERELSSIGQPPRYQIAPVGARTSGRSRPCPAPSVEATGRCLRTGHGSREPHVPAARGAFHRGEVTTGTGADPPTGPAPACTRLAPLLRRTHADLESRVPAPTWSASPSTCATKCASRVMRQRVVKAPFEAATAVWVLQRPAENRATRISSPPSAGVSLPLTAIRPASSSCAAGPTARGPTGRRRHPASWSRSGWLRRRAARSRSHRRS